MNRTFPDNIRFQSSAEPCLQKNLFNVLSAYGHHDPQVGYCQVGPGVSAWWGGTACTCVGEDTHVRAIPVCKHVDTCTYVGTYMNLLACTCIIDMITFSSGIPACILTMLEHVHMRVQVGLALCICLDVTCQCYRLAEEPLCGQDGVGISAPELQHGRPWPDTRAHCNCPDPGNELRGRLPDPHHKE